MFHRCEHYLGTLFMNIICTDVNIISTDVNIIYTNVNIICTDVNIICTDVNIIYTDVNLVRKRARRTPKAIITEAKPGRRCHRDQPDSNILIFKFFDILIF